MKTLSANERMTAGAIKLRVGRDAASAARRAAAIVASAGRTAIAERGRFLLALSGGSTPLPMFRALAATSLAWSRVQLFQVDERVASRGSDERNLSAIESTFGMLCAGLQIHAMPVESSDLAAAARDYEAGLRRTAGDPAVLDMIHLGLGEDGHTASLLPGDAALAIDDRDVGIAGPYQGSRRMTLTLPVINRARARLWLVCGERKSAMAARLLDRDRGIPAGLVDSADSWLITDRRPSPARPER